ncbi:alpha/beta fold hydrolase [Cupriavidus sp. 30B13]|uniref:alpha/beta fold hydrolase n=1 Tax=Cupriavidus sp. 30B13 TaxID=3384241 RepID=UPI003B8EB1E6
MPAASLARRETALSSVPPTGYIQTRDGVSLFVRDWHDGGPAAATVLFVSSWALPSDSWSCQMQALRAAGLRCIAYDRRGHGRSGDPGRGYDFDTLADDLAAVIEALDLRRVTLVGHSMAAGEIVRYLSRHGAQRVAGMVLVGCTTPCLARSADNPEGIDPAILDHVAGELADDFPRWVENNLAPFGGGLCSAPRLEWVRAMALQTSLQALLGCSHANTHADFRAELPAIRVPALLVHGDQDVSCPLPLTAQRTAALLPDARLRVYEGAPHGLPYTHGARLCADLLGFVRELA